MDGPGISKRDFLKLTALSAVALSGQKVFSMPSKTDFGLVRFAIISDLHLDVQGKNGMKMSAISELCLQKTVQDLNEEKGLSFVFVLGDLLQDGEVENVKVVRSLLNQLHVPYFVVSGNHDYAPADDAKRRAGFNYLTSDDFVKFFEGHGYEPGGKHYYARQIVPGLRVIGLDACQPGVKGTFGGYLPPEQFQWLEKQLEDHSDEINLIFVHHNLMRWTPDEMPGQVLDGFAIKNEPQIRALFAKYAQAVPVVFSGHRHVGVRHREEQGTNYFVVPSLNSHPMRYSVYSLTKDSIAWKSPMVSVDETAHIQARENLLNAPMWRTSAWKNRTAENDEKVLNLYENSAEVIGKIKV